ncbi:homeobox and c2h2 transcription factor [Colletotrichum karsti]|uniref:Homeobox and c2h2 transcription factor n=1 Tax=Colletotrichum karsti TaxID=1095194 RepID=A0A9P6HVV2_9PEZI|nr:homeobox and c2h2 transcription factor [Colletotrichum karsti]KAF9870922.1 homeobox and c2h2 transcription factor [Colletotrichum karsti]
MDKGSNAANDSNARDVDDFTALEFQYLTSQLTNPSNLDISGIGQGDSFLQDLQNLDADELLRNASLSSHDESAFALDPAVTGDSSQDSSQIGVPGNNTSLDDASLFLFSEALGDGEPMDHLPASETNTLDLRSATPSQMATPPKIGTRFSSKSLRLLKTWLSNNMHHPYPSTADMELLERQTGLSRQQITNWLANTRRRNRFKVPPKRPPSPAITSASSRPININSNSLSQGFGEMNPMQRWQVSPPEHEPASASAIAHAVHGLPPGSELPADRSLTDSAPTRSLYNASSASSAGTSHSSRSSMNSAYSHNSRSSLRSADPLGKTAMKRRRRRGVASRPERKNQATLWQTPNMYQCTFCTETFKTKHNWQRHEKSLHLSLERWECTPTGPTVADASGQLVCVFCGDANPDKDHLEQHNYSACKERMPEDRTFYRKDHLQQHLKLVHDAKFLRWPMGEWKHENEMIRSRCGFCALVMGSWSDRIDHIAEHFKDGKTMEEWHGDWGFDDHVLTMVENSMAPYMIHMERYSPWPFTTKQGVPETPPNAYELIKVEVDHFASDYQSLNDRMPTNAELLYESCCIIFGTEPVSLSKRPATPASSWLRDLLMSSDVIVKQARVRPLKTARKSRITYLCINGKADIFDQCTLEEQLQSYVDISKLIEPEISDADLQREACSIVERLEATSMKPSETFTSFLHGLINESTHWLTAFRQRAELPPSQSAEAPTLDISNQDFLRTSITDPAGNSYPTGMESSSLVNSPSGGSNNPTDIGPGNLGANGVGSGLDPEMPGSSTRTTFFVNEENCYRRLALSLKRFVKITTSSRNPNRHIPSDAELQHQARWISFEDDDPWNTTPADSPQWLREFKREMGILEEDAIQTSG